MFKGTKNEQFLLNRVDLRQKQARALLSEPSLSTLMNYQGYLEKKK